MKDSKVNIPYANKAQDILNLWYEFVHRENQPVLSFSERQKNLAETKQPYPNGVLMLGLDILTQAASTRRYFCFYPNWLIIRKFIKICIKTK